MLLLLTPHSASVSFYGSIDFSICKKRLLKTTGIESFINEQGFDKERCVPSFLLYTCNSCRPHYISTEGWKLILQVQCEQLCFGSTRESSAGVFIILTSKLFVQADIGIHRWGSPPSYRVVNLYLHSTNEFKKFTWHFSGRFFFSLP